MRIAPIVPFLVLAAAMPPLSAQSLDFGGRAALSLATGPFQLGLQGFVVLPQGNLRSAVGGRAGFQLGAHGSLDLDGGFELRPRIDYSRLDGGAFSFATGSSTNTIQSVSAGADCLLYTDGSHLGCYGMAGANLAWWDVDTRFAGQTRQTSPTLLAGSGYRFNRALALELELEHGQFQPSAGTENAVKLGAFFKF